MIKKLLGAHGLWQGENSPVRRAALPTLRLVMPGQIWLQYNVSKALMIVSI